MKWIKRKWNLLGALTILWFIFTVVYAWRFVDVPTGSTRNFEVAKFVFTSISAFGVLFSALIASFNALEASHTTQQRMDFDRIENTFAYFGRWDSPVLRAVKKVADDMSQNKILDKIRTDPNLERSVITMFNFFEEIYLSIEVGRVSTPLLRDGFGESYASMYGRFQKWIANHLKQKQQKNLAELLKLWT
jgi:hypothetical protein